jgi:hypothetical protein
VLVGYPVFFRTFSIHTAEWICIDYTLGTSGSGHGYERDPSDDSGGDVDEARVNRLLTERVASKRAREYDKADQLRDELRAMGVEVNDKDRCWRLRGGGQRQRRHGDDRGRKRERATEDRGGSFANDGNFLQDFEEESRHEGNVRQKRGGGRDDDRGGGDGQDGAGDNIRGTDPAAPFKKPSAALDPSKMLGLLQSVAGGGDAEHESKPVEEQTSAPPVAYTAEDANKLAAEAVRAKLMGDMTRHDKLMAKLERVKQSSGGGSGRSKEGGRGKPAGASAAKKTTDSSNEEVVIISELDADGA